MSNFNNLPIGDLLRLYIVRGMEGESKISEHWGDIVASRFKVRFYQWLGAMAGMGGILFGAVLLGTPVAMALGRGSILDILLVGVVIGIAALAVSSGLMYVFRDSRSKTVVAILAAGLTSFVVLAVVLVAIALSEDMDWWRAVLAIGGACLFTPSLAYTYNQLSDLVDPMGWISGFERMMRPYLVNLMQSEIKTQETPLIPWTQHKDRRLITSKSKSKEADGVEKVPHHLDIELADFLKEALVRGLSRDSGWLDKKKAAPYILPSTGATVRRGKYDALIIHAVKHGYVHKDDDSTTWAMDPAKAYDDWCNKIEGEWADYLEVSDG